MSSNKNPQQQKPIDPLLAQRLEALSRRKGAPLPPPAAATRAASSASPKASGAAPSSAAEKLAAARAAAGMSAKPGGKPLGSGGKRVKPARGAKAASLALSVVTTGALTALFANSETPADSVQLTAGTASALTPATGSATLTPATAPVVNSAVTTPVVVPVTASSQTAAPQTAAPQTAAPQTAAPQSGGIADGTYQGAPSQNRFGVVQVQAVYSGGQLSDVQILQYPAGDRRSLRISQYALPRLIDQALSAQGTNISGISGATYTSRSYARSLQSAIDAAKAASGISG